MSEPNFNLEKSDKNSALISWPNFSFSTKLSIIHSSSVTTLTTVATSTIFHLALLHTRVTSADSKRRKNLVDDAPLWIVTTKYWGGVDLSQKIVSKKLSFPLFPIYVTKIKCLQFRRLGMNFHLSKLLSYKNGYWTSNL